MNDDLVRHAQAAGIETSFVDVDGVERHADETSLRLLLDMLARPGAAANAIVVRYGEAIELPAGADGPPVAVLRKREHVLARSVEAQLALPDDLPRGDYRLDLTFPDGARRSVPLLHTPSRAYQPGFAIAGRKAWVLGLQLYSLGSARNFGHGDFTDLRRLLELTAAAGGAGVGINPLHALAEDDPDAASPYAPSSRVFLNWRYIDVGRLPGLAREELTQPDAQDEGQEGLIDYQRASTAKERILRLAWQRFEACAPQADQHAFAAFRRRAGPDLRRYAAFCLLRRREGGAWRFWRRPWAQPSPQDLAALAEENADEIGFHEFVQFQAHRQLMDCTARARALGMEIGLYLDVAVGVHPDGFDAWNDPDAFLQGAGIGAPPDALNKAGQNWGLTGFHPAVLRQRGYEPFRKMLGASMRYAGAIRIDHVLGLNRLYVIPPGAEATQGVYLRYPLHDLLAVVAMESQFHRCLVIGEDLGTVPAGLREALKDFGIWTYRVTMFEQDDTGFLPPERYPEAALATFSTHDLPTFAGWSAGADIELTAALGLPAADDAASRRQAVQRLRQALHAQDEVPAYDDMVAFLFRTEARLVSLSLEDLLGLSRQTNVPGIYREYPNWRHSVSWDPQQLARRLDRIRQISQTVTGGERNAPTPP